MLNSGQVSKSPATINNLEPARLQELEQGPGEVLEAAGTWVPLNPKP